MPGRDRREPPALRVEMRAIDKAFGAHQVLHGVDFDVRPGEVHVLAGENGAGKSTLIKVLAGVHRDYGGWVLLDGEPCRFSGPLDARRRGIAVIHQELSLIGSLSITDNLFLGRERRTPFGTVAHARQRDEARRALAALGLDADVDRPLASYPVAVQQLVEIARATLTRSRVLILDEPTSALAESDAERLFGRLRELTARGTGIVYITHRLQEIDRLADRITVLRDGVRVGTSDRASLPRDRLIHWMVGRALRDLFPAHRTPVGDVILDAGGLTVRDPTLPVPRVDSIAFTLRAGEVLGLGGLQGSGGSAVLHALFGAVPARGRVTLEGAALPLGDPRAAIRRGLALLTNDRKGSGIVPTLSVRENITLAALPRLSPAGLLSRRLETPAAEAAARRLGVRAQSLAMPITALSGGNQQKALLARWLAVEPRVLLLDEPTRGVDIGAKAEIHALVRRHVAAGGAVLLITSELEELIGLSHRILVLHRGRVTAELDALDATPEAIVHAAMGAPEEATA